MTFISRFTRVSVVIPLYNKEETIGKCLNSILNQSCQDFEIIIVNDGSTDKSLEKVMNFRDERIRVFSQSNSGVSSARNSGVRHSTAELITFIDADDVWLPHFLETILNLYRDFPDAQWAATRYCLAHAEKKIKKNIVKCVDPGFTRGLIHNYFQIASISDPLVHSSSVCIKRHILDELGGFPLGIYSGEDLLTWATIAAHYPLAYDMMPAAHFYVSGIRRRPDPEFSVLIRLIKILVDNPNIRGLRQYIALWCRMQAVSALRDQDRWFACQMSFLSLRYDALSLKNIYICALSLLPIKASNRLDKFLRDCLEFIRSKKMNVNRFS